MSRGLLMTVTVCALGAAVQGWDQTGSNGASKLNSHAYHTMLSYPADLSFPAEFGIAKGLDEPGGTYDQWILGLVNSIPYLSAPLM